MCSFPDHNNSKAPHKNNILRWFLKPDDTDYMTVN